MIKGKVKSGTTSGKKPRISVNKLAEYLEASPTRRKKIVEDAKYPEKFIVTRYKDAREISKGFVSGDTVEDDVLEKIQEFEDFKGETDFQDQDVKLSAEALTSMLEADTSPYDDLEISNYDDKNELIEISGVDVSVNPDLVTRKEVDGAIHVGAIKLHISKNNTLSNESQKIVCVLLYLYAGKFIKGEHEVESGKLCSSFDLFGQSIEFCPTSYKLRLKKIEAACEEIALWWDSL